MLTLLMSLSFNRDKIVHQCVFHHELVIPGVTTFSSQSIALKETLNQAFHLSNYPFELFLKLEFLCIADCFLFENYSTNW